MTIGTCADWVEAGATIGLFIAAIVAACIAIKHLGALRESSDNERLSTFLDEISGDEASNDRGLVRKEIKPNTNVNVIKEYVSMGRKLSLKFLHAKMGVYKPDINEYELNVGLIGIAVEKTIIRYDRVALFIARNKFRTSPPDWLLADVNMIWSRLNNWIDFRRNTEEDEYRSPYFAKDLEKLFKNPETEKLRRAKQG